jgi:acyl-CoA thioesterase
VSDETTRVEQHRQALLDHAAQFPFFRLIGLELVDAQPGWSKSRLTWRPDLTQPAGVMHGGVIATLVDTGIAYALLLQDDVRRHGESGGTIVSVDLRIKYFRPVSEGPVLCEARVVRPGRRIMHAEAIVTNADDKEVARGDAIYAAIAGDELRRRSDRRAR